MAQNINTNNKYYSLRNSLLETGEFYTTIKNQTFQQDTFYSFSSATMLFSDRSASDVSTMISENMFYLANGIGTLTLMAFGTDFIDGYWNMTINGTSQLIIESNPLIIRDDSFTNLQFVSGFNTCKAEFVFGTDVSAQPFSITGVFENSWEE